MHNIGYEIKKIITNRLTIYIFAITFLINGFVIAKKPSTIRNYYDNKSAYDEMYQYLGGNITEEKVSYVTEKYEELYAKSMSRTLSTEYDDSLRTGYEITELSLYSEMYKKYQYILNYSDNIENVRSACEENSVFYDYTGNKALKNYNRSILNTYNHRDIKDFRETKNWKYYLEYSFSNLCILITILCALKGIFSNERETNMSMMIITCRYGKSRCFVSKITAGIIIALGITAAFIIEDFVMFNVTFGYKGIMNPVYSIEEMQYCIYDVSILGYIVILNLFRIAGMLGITSIILLSSSLAQTNLVSVVLGVAGILPFIILNQQNIPFNIVRLLQINQDAAAFNSIFIMNRPVIYINYCLVTGILMSVVFITLAYIVEVHCSTLTGRERV